MPASGVVGAASESSGRGEPGAPPHIRIAVASADPALRLQLRRLLPSAQGFEMVGSARFGAALRETLAESQPHALIVDARQKPDAAAEALALARPMALRTVLLQEAGQPAIGPATVVLIVPAELPQERADGVFGRSLVDAAGGGAARTQGPPDPRLPRPPGGGSAERPAASVTRAQHHIELAGPRLMQRGDAGSALHALLPKPELIAIGCSTGGPQALLAMFRALRAPLPVPVLLTQHMPPRFTRMLAQQISQVGHTAWEAEQGMPLRPGHVYVAPGGQHLTIERRENALIAALDDGAPENFCKPSVDVMLRAVTKVCGGRCLAVILTGMGSDGLLGCRQVFDVGGTILAQDEATSVVWGMPGAVANAGICRAVLPLRDIAPAVSLLVPR